MDNPVYVLATDEQQALALFAVYRYTPDDKDALAMMRTGMINRTEADAAEHQARAGTGKIYAVDVKINECST